MSEAATVLVGGEEFHVTPDQPFSFGRADGGGIVGLDATDMGISGRAGSVEWAWGLWWLLNHSRKRRLLMDDGTGGQPQRLECGQRFAINVTRLTVLVLGAIYTHRIEVLIPESELARVTGRQLSSGTLIADELRLSERDKDAVVAVFSGYFGGFSPKEPSTEDLQAGRGTSRATLDRGHSTQAAGAPEGAGGSHRHLL